MPQYFDNDESIKSAPRLVIAEFDSYRFNFYSDNGVFSKNGVDYGTKLLIETFLKEGKKGKIVDVGSGVGVIGIVLAKLLDCDATLLEVNKRAIELSKKNITINGKVGNVRVIESDVYSNLEGKYDYIITNPPIRAGKKVVNKILLESYDYLVDGGELWFVIRKDQGALTAKRDVEEKFGNCTLLERSKGFMILKATKVER